ncbi:MFS transporter [Amycolatopsis sp. H20-H5]|uniref:MFS transporter n=1 Tax=Amycolatopsis sp. H20-H5 TaxID=3046309 RepID=UPI002DB8BDA9|nr:MFS transporter [Amycolatopsis sp. H20-H5]MEC3978051.1 MFS transporter [Amycolatopsis sp. H20-H5]
MSFAENPVSSRRGALWAPQRRVVTAGVLLLVTLMGFESMGVGAAMPTLAADLHGTALYAWPFIAFLAASLASVVVAGRLCDRSGPKLSLFTGPLLFVAGLLVAGSAPSMAMLLIGRVVQGLGDGMLIVPIYVVVGLLYPERDQPSMFGALSAAWVVPSLVGPALAGWCAEHLTWRWVFFAIVPFALLGWMLVLPVLRTLPQHTTRGVPVRRALLWAAFASAGGIAAISWALQARTAAALVTGAIGIALLAPSVRVLLPPGTLRARRGLPVTILARGLLTGTFFAAETFIPLTLSRVHGYPATASGLPLTLGALGWAGASLWQSRRPGLPRDMLVRRGFLLSAVGIGAMTLIAPTWGPAWLTAPLWTVAGAGVGLATSSLSVLTLSASSDADRGFNSSAIQVSDLLGAALFTGLGGALVTGLSSAEAPTAGVVVLDLLMVGVALFGAAVTRSRCRT